MDFHKTAELVRQHREIFVQERTKQETKFNNWKAALLKCSKEQILDKIPFEIENATFQTFIPEWYVDKPNKEIAHQQVVEFNKKIELVNSIVEEFNMKGMELLNEYKGLTASK